MSHLNCFDPPILETFAYHYWRYKFLVSMRDAVKVSRDPELYLPDLNASYFLGRASMAVSVLYDTGHPKAYKALHALTSLENRLKRKPR